MQSPALAGVPFVIIAGLCLEARPGVVSAPSPAPTRPHERAAALAPSRPTAAPQDETILKARRLRAAGKAQEAADLLESKAERLSGDPDYHECFAEVEEALGRTDRAAEQYDRMLAALARKGEEKSSRYRSVRKRLFAMDPVAQARLVCTNKAVGGILESCQTLVEYEYDELAHQLLGGLVLIATGDELVEAEKLLADVSKRFTAVDLDAAGKGISERVMPKVTVVTDHYRVEANLERRVTQLVADTMDDIFTSYVQIYLDGDESRAESTKCKLRIHGNWTKMTEEHPGDEQPAGLGGWWEPWSRRVVCYDTRTDSGTLDVMLGTLFHEASHQFMTMLADRGGHAPAWLNEGTASFFEGAKAMADGTVLWPDAARSRLENLHYMLTQVKGPTFEDVIGYKLPGSYPGEYYAWGWGIVYYLQEYEDPDTFEYVWRRPYSTYRDKITTTSPPLDPRELFEDVFANSSSPLGFEDVTEFFDHWRDWIVNEIHPLHFGTERRERRLARVERYLEAADRAKDGDSVGPADLLERALRDLEYVRSEIDEADEPDVALILKQIEVLRRLGRDSTEAALIEEVLDLVDAAVVALPEDEYKVLEKRMYDVDKKNEHPRRAKARIKNLRKRARSVLAEYEELEEPLAARAASFARNMGTALDDRAGLLAAAERLERGASATPVGEGEPIAGESWWTIFRDADYDFTTTATSVGIRCDDEAAGRICTDVTVAGDYTLHGTLVRKGEGEIGSSHGIVVHGTKDGSWLVVKVGSRGRLHLERWSEVDGELDSERIERVRLDEPLEEDESPTFSIRVSGSTITVQLGAEELRGPVELELSEPLAAEGHAGVFAEAGETVLEHLRVERD